MATKTRFILLAVGALVGTASLRGAVEGVLLFSDYPSGAVEAVEFQGINWKSAQAGEIKRIDGSVTAFKNDCVAGIVYFHPAYLLQLESSASLQPLRVQIRTRETVVDSDPSNVLTPADADHLDRDAHTLEKIAKQFPVCAPKLNPALKTIRQQLDRYARGERKQTGRWLKADESATRQPAAQATSETLPPFTTRTGTKYSAARITSIDNDSFSITHEGGVARIRFDELPSDLAGLPLPIQTAARAARNRLEQEKRAEADRVAREAQERKAREAALSTKTKPPDIPNEIPKEASPSAVASASASSPSDREEGWKQKQARAQQDLELHTKDAGSIRERLRVEARDKLVVKGLFLGMQLDDCYAAFQPYLGDRLHLVREIRESEIKRKKYDVIYIDEYVSGAFGEIGQIRADCVTKKVNLFFFSPELSDYLFNSWDMGAEDFAQTFINSYNIPKLKPTTSLGQNVWRYEDGRGCTVMLLPDKTVDISVSVERKFGD